MIKSIILIDNEFATLWYYPDVGVIHHKFHQPVSGDSFRGVLLTGLSLMKEHGAQKWLSDDRLNSILPAEDSAWSQEYWLPRALKAGWKCWAVLPPAKARGQINMERLMGFVGETSDVKIKIFSDSDEAWQWLAQGCEADSIQTLSEIP
jgi:hypothetical protein